MSLLSAPPWPEEGQREIFAGAGSGDKAVFTDRVRPERVMPGLPTRVKHSGFLVLIPNF